jgi:hypothetical protein
MNLRDLVRQGLQVEIICDSCKSITYIDPEDLHFKMNVELSFLNECYPCPNCDVSNSEVEGSPVRIRGGRAKEVGTKLQNHNQTL